MEKHSICISLRDDVSIKVLKDIHRMFLIEDVSLDILTEDIVSMDFIITVTVEEMITFVQEFDWACSGLQDLDQTEDEDFVYMAESY